MSVARCWCLLKDTPATRKLIHRYIDVFEYPDGRIELRADGANLAYQRYDRLPQIDTAAIVENKRLGHALQAAMVIQAQRDDRHASNTPSRTNSGQAPYVKNAMPGSKRSRQFTAEDLEAAIRVAGRPTLPAGTRKVKDIPGFEALLPASG